MIVLRTAARSVALVVLRVVVPVLVPVVVLMAALVCALASAAEAIPAADFFRSPVLNDPVVSPSSRHVAVTMNGGPNGRRRLVVLNLQDIADTRMVAEFADADIDAVQWANDERLVFSVTDAQSPYADQWGEGLFSVDREGKEAVRRLIKRRLDFVTSSDTGARVDRELSAYHRFHSVLRDGSNDVVVSKFKFDARRGLVDVSLLRVDTATGRSRAITEGAPDQVWNWALDRQGVPRAALSIHGGKSRLHVKSGPNADWQMVQEFDTYAAEGAALLPLAVGKDDVLYGRATVGAGVDTQSLVRQGMDAKGSALQPLLSLKGYDFNGSLVFGAKGDLLGVRYLNDARNTFWFDPQLKQMQASVDRLLPATINRLDCGDCSNPATVVVSARSDRQPSIYFLYDVKTAQLKPMARSRPWLDGKAMATRDMVRIATRDGLDMPVHLTRPPAQMGPAPLVVLVHGGPYVRGGEWAWEEWSQFLASRGYVVVEPEFRGSAGFGAKHLRAGFKQWGLAMQDDIADAALWAIRQGHADPARVCIAGASYGGYAALMGLIRHPEIYRCGVNWAGVTDLDLLYAIDWSDMSDLWKNHGMPTLVGDRVGDAAQLAATSPLKQASRLNQPLLMAYGALDLRVPLEHGVKLRDALRVHNPHVEWKTYDQEGHGWMLEANRIDFAVRVEKFLDRHLKNAR